MVERGRKLDAAARDVGVLGRGLDHRSRRDFLRRLAHRHAVGGHAAGRDRGLRARAALEQAARDQKAIGTLAGSHGALTIIRASRRAAAAVESRDTR